MDDNRRHRGHLFELEVDANYYTLQLVLRAEALEELVVHLAALLGTSTPNADLLGTDDRELIELCRQGAAERGRERERRAARGATVRLWRAVPDQPAAE